MMTACAAALSLINRYTVIKVQVRQSSLKPGKYDTRLARLMSAGSRKFCLRLLAACAHFWGLLRF